MDKPDSVIKVGDVVNVDLGEYEFSGVTVVSLPSVETGNCWVVYHAPSHYLYHIKDFEFIWREPEKLKAVK
jgi:hypothetical protein